ncbi:MAG: hypothetical protein ACO1PI_03615 [Bacteroidota bacterium]
MKQFRITSRARHLRYIFFIDEKYPYKKLFDLLCLNQRIWGGRYNPFIPVREDKISDKYIKVLKNYDPDFVFYTESINPEIIKELRIFNPSGYYNLDKQPREEDITGVDAFYFLSQLDASSKILLPDDLSDVKSILLDYYKINFGLDSRPLMSDFEIGKSYHQILIGTKNFASLNQILHTEKPVNKARLARRNLNTKILRPSTSGHFNGFELVVAKDRTTIDDLIYYWNRLLFGCENIIYVTVDELTILSKDKFFGGVLYDMSTESFIDVVSMTLNKEDVNELIESKLKPISSFRSFKYKSVEDFPFEVLDANGFYERDYGESVISQTVISERGLLHLPKLSFINKIDLSSQKWAVDITIEGIGSDYQNEVKFPYTTETQFIIKTVKGRINRNRNISIYIHSQLNKSDVLEIIVPEFGNLLRQIIARPVVHGLTQETEYVDIGPHDASNKLSAFLKAFNYNFSTIDDFFTDKFWVDIFEELIKSNKAVGDSILLSELKNRCIEALATKGVFLGERGTTYRNEENLQLGLEQTLKELCRYKVFLKGFNLKCKKCSSEFWYHINEVGEAIVCKGCYESFELPIEPNFAYKLNDLIKNNIYQTKTARDGNLTVIRTLASINRDSRKSFAYSPQVNLYNDYHSNKPCAEIDVICLSDGKLIIGEAKHKSNLFFEGDKKSLKALVELSKAIYPDKIILSCYEDTNGKLEKAKQGLIHLFNKWPYQPEIESIILHTPDYFALGGHRYFYH